MPRPLHLIIYTSPLFPAHWSLYIPHQRTNPPHARILGTRIHATGDALNGFTTEFERNYDINAESRAYRVIELGEVSDEHVVDVLGDGDGRCSTDQDARDEIERVALRVPAPGGSLNSTGAKHSESRKRVNISNCQTWLRDVVVKLVENGILDGEARGIIDAAPKN